MTSTEGRDSSVRNRGRDGDHGRTEEPDAERINRNLSDLLQELRVAGLGVQMLFGFLLALPFTVRFGRLDGAQVDVYRLSLLSAAAATALLISPVAYHRWVFRRHQKSKLVRLANVEALIGLGLEAVSLSCAVTLIFSVVGSSWIFSALVSVVIGGFVFLWFALPIFDRITAGDNDADAKDHGASAMTRAVTHRESDG